MQTELVMKEHTPQELKLKYANFHGSAKALKSVSFFKSIWKIWLEVALVNRIQLWCSVVGFFENLKSWINFALWIFTDWVSLSLRLYSKDPWVFLHYTQIFLLDILDPFRSSIWTLHVQHSFLLTYPIVKILNLYIILLCTHLC